MVYIDEDIKLVTLFTLAVSVALTIGLASGIINKKNENEAFILISLASPFIMLIFPRSLESVTTLVRSTIFTVFWLLIYFIYILYRISTESANKPSICDGPCSGWYTFENDPVFIPLFVIGFLAVLLSSILAFVGQFIAKKLTPKM